jgi:hypothetical protein
MNELIAEDTLDLIAKLETYYPEGNINHPWVVGFRHVLEWKGMDIARSTQSLLAPKGRP